MPIKKIVKKSRTSGPEERSNPTHDLLRFESKDREKQWGNFVQKTILPGRCLHL